MKRVVILGAGGHAREVADILRQQAQQSGSMAVLGFVADDLDLQPRRSDNLSLLGDWSWFDGADRSEIAVICAVGLPQVRHRLVERAKLKSLPFISAISPLAYISPGAKVGAGAMIFPYSFISDNSLIGDHAIINAGATVSHDTKVSCFGTLSPGVHLAGNVSVGEGCYLGIGANIIQGISLGSWSTVGAGAVVIRDLPDNATAVGSPARIIKMKDRGWYEQETSHIR